MRWPAHLTAHHGTGRLPEGALRADAILDLLRHFDSHSQTRADPNLLIARAVASRASSAIVGLRGDECVVATLSLARQCLMRLTHLPAGPRGAAVAVGEPPPALDAERGRSGVQGGRPPAEASRSDPSFLMAGLSNYLSSPKTGLVSAGAPRVWSR